MASTSQTPAPSPASCQSNFEQGVACAMHLWPRLDDAVEDQLGGPDSADKRDWFVGSVVDLFPDLTRSRAQQQAAEGATEEPEQYDVEYRLVQVLDDEFELKLDDDDDSAEKLAEQIMRVRAGCLRGAFEAVEELQRMFGERSRGPKKARKVVIKEEDNETDWDTEDGEDDEDEDVEMGDAPPALVPVKKEKAAPEVDEDGFTKVTRKKK